MHSLENTLLLTIEKELNNLEKFYFNFKRNWNNSMFYNEIKSNDWVDIEIYKIAISNYPLLLNKIIDRSISLEICLRALRDKIQNENN
jgi:hypothetical protein